MCFCARGSFIATSNDGGGENSELGAGTLAGVCPRWRGICWRGLQDSELLAGAAFVLAGYRPAGAWVRAYLAAERCVSIGAFCV